MAEAIASIRAGTPSARLEALALDLSTADAAIETTKRFPEVDILVNNLGIYELKPFEQISDAEWSAIIETNFLSCVRVSRHYLPRMKTAGWGRIIFISSKSAVNIPVEMIHYGGIGCNGKFGAGRPNPFGRRGLICRRNGKI